MVATRTNQKDSKIIGNFTPNSNAITGQVRTLTGSMKARAPPNRARLARRPHHVRAAEVAAAWNKVSGDSEPFISVIIDDPSVNAINAAL